MHWPFRMILLVLISLGLAACGTNRGSSPPATSLPATPLPATPTPRPGANKPGWELVWADEFEASSLNRENWIPETGAGGWGNNERQFYTDRPENVRLENGHLIIEARKESYRGSDYTSARLKTQYLHSWAYGRMEARLKLPTGQGIWPAFWMLGDDFPTAGWPGCGEIDIMENIGDPLTVYGTVHGPGYSGGGGIGESYTSSQGSLAEEFHVYAVEWTPTEISWFVDDVRFNTITSRDVPGEWVYDHPFFLILNLAVGGNWPGYPDQTTEFPQQLVVDYVRVYRDPDLSAGDLEGGVLHVADLQMTWEEGDEKWEAAVNVSVVDSSGNPVGEVDVTGGWLGVVTGAAEHAVSNQQGVAGPFLGLKTNFAEEVTFCITDLSKPLYSYQKDQNEQTCITGSPEPKEKE